MFKKQKPTPERTRQRSVPGASRSVFSYYGNRPEAGRRVRRDGPETPAAGAATARAKRPQRFGQVPARIGMVLLIGAALYNCAVSASPRILPVNIGSGSIFMHTEAEYARAAADAVRESPLQRTKLTLDPGKIESRLRSAFPELKSVEVQAPLIGTHLAVHIEPAKPKLLLRSGADVFVVDEAGRALIQAGQVRHLEKLKLPVVTDQSGLSIELGEQALPSRHVTYITEVVSQLAAKKVVVTGLTLLAGTSQLDVTVQGASYTVKFNLQGDARVGAGTYLAVKAQLERENKTPSAYIDVRVEDRAYYK